jgi:anhydro-N-acetylmuramic acid kinase
VSSRELFIGVMSGTSLDGADAALVEFAAGATRILAAAHVAFEAPLRAELLALNEPGADEIERAALAGNELARRYAAACREALERAACSAGDVRAVGCHGQTVRHRPERGYTVQIGNPALLAELTGIRVVADFRSRDIAAGGQGAPLAPAFHARAFADLTENRAVLNIGGIANLTWLPRNGSGLGFDCGPGNCLLDLWAAKHLGKAYDEGGAWAAGGRIDEPMLVRLLEEPFLAAPPPKSTGRELFNERWLAGRLRPGTAPRDVQATLLEYTARCAANACRRHLPGLARVIVCGGGARNEVLVRRLQALLAPIALETSDRFGVDAQLVEAAAFAWLAKLAIDGTPALPPHVTGASGTRVLGAIYPK